MKLIRFGLANKEKPGIELSDGTRIDVSAFGEDYNEFFFGSSGIKRLAEWLSTNKSNCPIIGKEIRLGSPIDRPSKIVCVGLNMLNTQRKVVWKCQVSRYFFLKQARQL